MPLTPDEYRDHMREYMKRRYHERRNEAVETLGGKCTECGSTENLEIDHIDRTKKSINVNRMTMVGRKRFLEELAKCQLLCQTHHREKSAAEQSVEHGGGVSGKRNCYCEKCAPLKRAYNQAWREARRASVA